MIKLINVHFKNPVKCSKEKTYYSLADGDLILYDHPLIHVKSGSDSKTSSIYNVIQMQFDADAQVPNDAWR